MPSPSRLAMLADQLFADRPAKDQPVAYDRTEQTHQYVASRIFGGSRGLHPVSHRPPERPWEAGLGARVLHVERLGPYEQQLLAALLRAPSPVIVITGATGGGKSSTLRHVLSFYDANAVTPPSAMATGVRPQHVRVNFNKLAPRYRELESHARGSGLAFLYETVPLRIADGILASLENVGAGQQKKGAALQALLDLAKQAHGWATHDEKVPHGAEFDWPELQLVDGVALTGAPAQDVPALHRRLLELSAASKQVNLPLIFWCAVLDALAIRAIPSNRATLLFLDNIDPLPDPAQAALKEQFLALCHDKHFKTVLTLRHSRVGTLKTDYALQYNWYPHCGPNPVEVVCHRLLNFVIAPETYPAFEDLDAEWRKRAVCRALDLLLRLTRGTPVYPRLGLLAAAASGESIRRALEICKTLFENEEFRFDYEDPETVMRAVRDLAVELKAVICCSHLGLALREQLIGMAIEHAGDHVAAHQVDGWAAQLATVARDVFERSFDGPRDFATARADGFWRIGDIQRLAEEDVASASKLFRARLILLGISAADAQAQLHALAAAFRQRAIASLGVGRDVAPGLQSLLSRIEGWIAQPDADPATDASWYDDPRFLQNWGPLQIGSKLLQATGSYAMAQHLVRSGHLQNLFDERGALSVVPLTLLYFIAAHDDGEAELSTVLALLENARMSRKRIVKLINRLCHEKGRLIWITGEFEHSSDELRALARRDGRVRLAQGGWAYYWGVLDEIDYLTESLASPPRHVLLSGRVDRALTQLQVLLDRSRHLPTGIPKNELWRSIQRTVALDAMVRATPRLTTAFRGHFQRMRELGTARHLHESIATRGVAIRWTTVLKESDGLLLGSWANRRPLTAKERELVPLGRVGSLRGLGPAAGTLRSRWARAIELMEEVLRGPKLWGPECGADEYRS